MVKPVFDTLKYSKKLISAGEDASIAAVHAEALAEIAEDKLATKEDMCKLEGDIQRLDKDLRQEMNLMETRLNGRIENLDVSLSGRMDKLENTLDSRMDLLSSQLTIRLGGMVAVGLALIPVIQKIF